jgi:hypothetical protein
MLVENIELYKVQWYYQPINLMDNELHKFLHLQMNYIHTILINIV